MRRVIYPGLAEPSAARARQGARCTAFGGMRHGRARPGPRRYETLPRALPQLFTLAESLGGVESLIEHPALMTHGSIPAETRAAIGISDAPGPPLGRHRGRGRPDRRPRSGAERLSLIGPLAARFADKLRTFADPTSANVRSPARLCHWFHRHFRTRVRGRRESLFRVDSSYGVHAFHSLKKAEREAGRDAPRSPQGTTRPPAGHVPRSGPTMICRPVQTMRGSAPHPI